MNVDVPSISLCSGSGMLDAAIDIALERFGCRLRPLAYVERDSAAAAHLVASMEAKAVGEAPVWDELETFDGSIFRPFMAGGIVTASLPCQPYSSAGKRIGADDHRSYGDDGRGPVYHAARIIKECGAAMGFFENVCEWVTGGTFQRFGEELCRMGLSIQAPLFVAASDVKAPHERERVFMLAYTEGGIEWLRQRIGTTVGAGGKSGTERYREELGNSGRTTCQRDSGSLCEQKNKGDCSGIANGDDSLRSTASIEPMADTKRDGRRFNESGRGSNRGATDGRDNQELANSDFNAQSTDGRESDGESNWRDNTGGRVEELAVGPRGGCGVGGEIIRDGQAKPGRARREGTERGDARIDEGSAARRSTSECRNNVGHAERAIKESWQENQARARVGIGCFEIPLFPPGRGDESDPEHPDWRAWRAIANLDSSLMPRTQLEVPALAHGMARADLLRIGGNGVCPLAATYAFHTLLSRAING